MFVTVIALNTLCWYLLNCSGFSTVVLRRVSYICCCVSVSSKLVVFITDVETVAGKLDKPSKCTVSCKIDNGKCSASAVCVPVPYGRFCLCKPGFIGNGFTCERQYLRYFYKNFVFSSWLLFLHRFSRKSTTFFNNPVETEPILIVFGTES